jgi:hypothetical protein
MNERDIAEQAYNNGYEKGYEAAKPKWIPVTERLPEECKEVLAYRLTGCEVDSCVSHQKAYWSYDTVSDYPVTHWMPLPEPPKGE